MMKMARVWYHITRYLLLLTSSQNSPILVRIHLLVTLVKFANPTIL